MGCCASHLGLFCLPMSHKKDARLIWVKQAFWHPSAAKKMKVTLQHFLWIVMLDDIHVFLFHIDLTLTVAMVTENGCHYRLK